MLKERLHSYCISAKFLFSCNAIFIFPCIFSSLEWVNLFRDRRHYIYNIFCASFSNLIHSWFNHRVKKFLIRFEYFLPKKMKNNKPNNFFFLHYRKSLIIFWASDHNTKSPSSRGGMRSGSRNTFLDDPLSRAS